MAKGTELQLMLRSRSGNAPLFEDGSGELFDLIAAPDMFGGVYVSSKEAQARRAYLRAFFYGLRKYMPAEEYGALLAGLGAGEGEYRFPRRTAARLQAHAGQFARVKLAYPWEGAAEFERQFFAALRRRVAYCERCRIYKATHREEINAQVRRYRAAHPEKRRAEAKAYRAAHGEEIRARDRARRAAHREEINARRRERYAARREELNVRQREYHAAHREERNARNRAYAAAHREELIAKRRAYYAANREELNARRRAYRAANREELNARRRERYAARREALNIRQREAAQG